jgi:hypothetical protein
VSLTKDQWIEKVQVQAKDPGLGLKTFESSEDEDMKYGDAKAPFGHQSALSVDQIVSIALTQLDESKEASAEEVRKNFFKTLFSIQKASQRGTIRKRLGTWHSADGEVGVMNLDLDVRITRPWVQLKGLSLEVLSRSPLDRWDYDILDLEPGVRLIESSALSSLGFS